MIEIINRQSRYWIKTATFKRLLGRLMDAKIEQIVLAFLASRSPSPGGKDRIEAISRPLLQNLPQKGNPLRTLPV